MTRNQSLLTSRMLRFLECQGAIVKPSTLRTYRIALNHLCAFLKERKKLVPSQLRHITTEDLDDLICYLNQKKVVPYTRVNYLLNIRLYLAWEAEHKKIKPEILRVLDRSKLPKVPEYLPRPLSAENDRLLQERFKTSNSPYAPLFLLLRHTGLRISELINLPFNPIVTNDKNEPFLKVPLGKMNNERMVPLSAETCELIQKIKIAFPICLNRSDNERLIGLRGSVCGVRSHLYYHFKMFVDDIVDQNKNVTFHRLRHTFATSLMSGGVSLVSIMKLLGHKRIEMSLRYAQVTPSHLRNEYLKAIAVIEKQTDLQKGTNKTSGEYHVVESLNHMMAYLKHAIQLPITQKKNILRRLSRIKNELEGYSCSHLFKMTSQPDHV